MARRMSDKSKQILHMGKGKGKDCFFKCTLLSGYIKA